MRSISLIWIGKKIRPGLAFSSRVKRKEFKSKDMMSLNKGFIVLMVSSRKGTNRENNVLQRPFTKEVTVYKVNCIYFPYLWRG